MPFPFSEEDRALALEIKQKKQKDIIDEKNNLKAEIEQYCRSISRIRKRLEEIDQEMLMIF